MKVVDGKFGKKEKEDLPVMEKIAIALSEMVGDSETKGNFILIVETESGVSQIGSDFMATDMVYMLEMMKTVAIMNSLETTEEVMH